MHITKSKKILDLIEMKSRILVIIVGMYCYWYSVTIWNGDSRGHIHTVAVCIFKDKFEKHGCTPFTFSGWM